jgi:hypothetical protein
MYHHNLLSPWPQQMVYVYVYITSFYWMKMAITNVNDDQQTHANIANNFLLLTVACCYSFENK